MGCSLVPSAASRDLGLRVALALALLLAATRADAADDPFFPFLDTTLRGGLAVGATCVNHAPPAEGGPTGGTIVVSSIPPGASVVGAWLYWSVLSDLPTPPSGSPSFAGQPITPVRVGEVAASPCFTQISTGVFRADVRAQVTGNGIFVLSGFPGTGTEFGDLTEGATLFVLWCDESAPLTDIVIWEGADVVRDRPTMTFSQAFGLFLADPIGPTEALLGVAAGNGQNRFPGDPDYDPLIFNGVDLDEIHPSILSGDLCQPDGLYDLTVVAVSPFVAPGSVSATLSLAAMGDCYSIGAIALVVRTDQTRTVVDPCSATACLATFAPPPRVIACGSAPADLDLSAASTGCPLGATQIYSLVMDPMSARDSTTSVDLAPPVAAGSADRATLTVMPGGDTDLVDCVELALVDPMGVAVVLKAVGEPTAQVYDVTAIVTLPGTWSVRLTETAGCAPPGTGTALLTAVRLVVEQDAGLPLTEFRVETMAGDVVSDWSTDPVVSLVSPTCPGAADLVVRARCVFDASCERSAPVELACGDPIAAFSHVATCGTQDACFQDTTAGGFGALAWDWDLAGEATSVEAAPCFTFLGAPPWSVTLRVTDELGCTSSVTESITPPPPSGPVEPSALDLVPGAEPLRVAKAPSGLLLTWQDVSPTQVDNAYRGFIGTWYSHAAVGACGLADPRVTLPAEPGDLYFVVAGAACDGTVSSVGRRSDGVDRPAPDPACP